MKPQGRTNLDDQGKPVNWEVTEEGMKPGLLEPEPQVQPFLAGAGAGADFFVRLRLLLLLLLLLTGL